MHAVCHRRHVERIGQNTSILGYREWALVNARSHLQSEDIWPAPGGPPARPPWGGLSSPARCRPRPWWGSRPPLGSLHSKPGSAPSPGSPPSGRWCWHLVKHTRGGLESFPLWWITLSQLCMEVGGGIRTREWLSLEVTLSSSTERCLVNHTFNSQIVLLGKCPVGWPGAKWDNAF